jgi:hypothetical protein
MRGLAVTLLVALAFVGSAQAARLSSDANEWRDAGFAADDARLWQRDGFTVVEASAWKRLVTSYRHAGRNNLQEAEIWRGWGYTPREAQHFVNELGGRFRRAQEMAQRRFSVTEALNVLRREQNLAPLPEPGMRCPQHEGVLAPYDGERALVFQIDDARFELLEQRQRADIDGITHYYFSFVNVNDVPVSFVIGAESGFAMHDPEQDRSWDTERLPEGRGIRSHDLPNVEVAQLNPGASYSIELWLPEGEGNSKERDAIGRIRFPDEDCRVYYNPDVDIGRFAAHEPAVPVMPTQQKGGGGKGIAVVQDPRDTDVRAEPAPARERAVPTPAPAPAPTRPSPSGGGDTTGAPTELLTNFYMTHEQTDGWVYHLRFCSSGMVRIARVHGDLTEFGYAGNGTWSWRGDSVVLGGNVWDVTLRWDASADPNRHLIDPRSDRWMSNSATGPIGSFWNAEAREPFMAPGC